MYVYVGERRFLLLSDALPALCYALRDAPQRHNSDTTTTHTKFVKREGGRGRWGREERTRAHECRTLQVHNKTIVICNRRNQTNHLAKDQAALYGVYLRISGGEDEGKEEKEV
jgi:hypothetical protein